EAHVLLLAVTLLALRTAGGQIVVVGVCERRRLVLNDQRAASGRRELGPRVVVPPAELRQTHGVGVPAGRHCHNFILLQGLNLSLRCAGAVLRAPDPPTKNLRTLWRPSWSMRMPLLSVLVDSSGKAEPGDMVNLAFVRLSRHGSGSWAASVSRLHSVRSEPFVCSTVY